MVDKEKLANEFAEAAELMDKSVDTDIASQQRTHREAELRDWSEAQARKIASEAGIELTDAHLQVVQSLREHYREHGPTESGRQLSEMLYDTFASEGGKKYLYNLFPRGPVRQGMLIAGLPAPAHTEDAGFGTTR